MVRTDMNVVPAAALYPGPSRERIVEIHQRYWFDAGNPWAGNKLGRYYGCLFHVLPGGQLVEVRYGRDGRELPIPKPQPRVSFEDAAGIIGIGCSMSRIW